MSHMLILKFLFVHILIGFHFVISKTIGTGNLKVAFSKSHSHRNRLRSYTQMVTSQKQEGYELESLLCSQIKAENVLHSMIPKTHFT